MKKLLCSAAVCGLALAATPASAQVSLELGGDFRGYTFYTDQDDNLAVGAGEAREFDIIRNTEVHMSGETTLDNGLTVGVHFEMEADGGTVNDSFNVQESYVYFSGGWGRVNFGAEDGAAYLLQVAAPSADSNVDGIRQFVSPVNYTAAAAPAALVVQGADGVDYDQNLTNYADKLTYLSPIMNGFQVGLTYTPDVADLSTHDALNLDDLNDTLGQSYEAAVRYEGTFNNVGVTLGAGYTQVDLERELPAFAAGVISDDRASWNVGADFDIGPFGAGIIYMEDDFGDIDRLVGAVQTTQGDEETLVVGVDYTTGPFKFGASYMDQDGTNGIVGLVGSDGIETKRWTGGVVYTYGPGMTFRGSISVIEHDNVAGLGAGNGDSIDATSVLLGTQINF